MQNRALLGAGFLLATLTTCDTDPLPVCGDGQVDPGETCDDQNLADGDGCSSVCEIEQEEALGLVECVDLVESPEAFQYSTLITPEGRVLVTGVMRATSSGPWNGWIGAFDLAGNQQWSMEFDGIETGVQRVRPKGTGFVFVHSAPGTNGVSDDVYEVVEVDAEGALLDTRSYDSSLPDTGKPIDLLDTPEGLLLGGTRDGDIWLAREGIDGSLELLALEDHLGHPDQINTLAASEEGFAALAIVSIKTNHIDDVGDHDTFDSLLIEYDGDGVELRRTLLTSGDEDGGLLGGGLTRGTDGTWYVSGNRDWTMGYDPNVEAWSAAVRDGEVLWSEASVGGSSPNGKAARAEFGGSGGVIFGDEIVFTGHSALGSGYLPYLVRRATDDGALVSELRGGLRPDVEAKSSGITGLAPNGEGGLWLVGRDYHEDRTVQWLCNVEL